MGSPLSRSHAYPRVHEEEERSIVQRLQSSGICRMVWTATYGIDPYHCAVKRRESREHTAQNGALPVWICGSSQRCPCPCLSSCLQLATIATHSILLKPLLPFCFPVVGPFIITKPMSPIMVFVSCLYPSGMEVKIHASEDGAFRCTQCAVTIQHGASMRRHASSCRRSDTQSSLPPPPLAPSSLPPTTLQAIMRLGGYVDNIDPSDFGAVCKLDTKLNQIASNALDIATYKAQDWPPWLHCSIRSTSTHTSDRQLTVSDASRPAYARVLAFLSNWLRHCGTLPLEPTADDFAASIHALCVNPLKDNGE